MEKIQYVLFIITLQLFYATSSQTWILCPQQWTEAKYYCPSTTANLYAQNLHSLAESKKHGRSIYLQVEIDFQKLKDYIPYYNEFKEEIDRAVKKLPVEDQAMFYNELEKFQQKKKTVNQMFIPSFFQLSLKHHCSSKLEYEEAESAFNLNRKQIKQFYLTNPQKYFKEKEQVIDNYFSSALTKQQVQMLFQDLEKEVNTNKNNNFVQLDQLPKNAEQNIIDDLKKYKNDIEKYKEKKKANKKLMGADWSKYVGEIEKLEKQYLGYVVYIFEVSVDYEKLKEYIPYYQDFKEEIDQAIQKLSPQEQALFYEELQKYNQRKQNNNSTESTQQFSLVLSFKQHECPPKLDYQEAKEQFEENREQIRNLYLNNPERYYQMKENLIEHFLKDEETKVMVRQLFEELENQAIQSQQISFINLNILPKNAKQNIVDDLLKHKNDIEKYKEKKKALKKKMGADWAKYVKEIEELEKQYLGYVVQILQVDSPNKEQFLQISEEGIQNLFELMDNWQIYTELMHQIFQENYSKQNAKIVKIKLLKIEESFLNQKMKNREDYQNWKISQLKIQISHFLALERRTLQLEIANFGQKVQAFSNLPLEQRDLQDTQFLMEDRKIYELAKSYLSNNCAGTVLPYLEDLKKIELQVFGEQIQTWLKTPGSVWQLELFESEELLQINSQSDEQQNFIQLNKFTLPISKEIQPEHQINENIQKGTDQYIINSIQGTQIIAPTVQMENIRCSFSNICLFMFVLFILLYLYKKSQGLKGNFYSKNARKLIFKKNEDIEETLLDIKDK